MSAKPSIFTRTQTKPKVWLWVLCGLDHGEWVHPALMLALLKLQKDPRFNSFVCLAYNLQPFQHARNRVIQASRDGAADVCIMLDNDQIPPDNFGDIIAASIAKKKLVVGLRTGYLQSNNMPALLPGDNGARDGEFQETRSIGTGVIIISSEVWKHIPRGPWFRWLENDDEVLSRKQSEDYYFVQQLLPQHGIKVWVHDTPAGHMKTCDVTAFAHLMRGGAMPTKSKPWEVGFTG
jgi:hypothetical protein